MTGDADEPLDPEWRFNPEAPPERFTRGMLRRMTIAQLIQCADPDRSPLSPDQQASFDEKYAELNAEVSEQIGASIRSVMPNLKVDMDALVPKVDIDALMPRVDFSFATNAAFAALNESTRSSFNRIQRDLAEHLAAAQRISVPRPETAEQEVLELPGSPVNDEPTEPAPVSDQIGGLTPKQLLSEVDEDLGQLSMLSTITHLLSEQSALMRDQAEVARGQREAAARGAVFYVVVGLGSALSGIATVVGLTSGEKRILALALTAALAVAALVCYFAVRWYQERGRHQV